jgi:two-component system NtrC family sensor kinase
VLIVDDDPAKRLAVRAVLEPLNLMIVEAESGLAALRRVIECDFAVILLDVRMPDIDGFETAALIRRRRESELTPIIFITAFASDEIGSLAKYVQGAVDFMFAPVQPDELRAKVSVFVGLFLQAQKYATEARMIQSSADQLKLLTDSAPIGIFRTDASNRYVYTNPRWSEISGISAEVAFGQDWEAMLSSQEPQGTKLDASDDLLEGGDRYRVWVSGSIERIVVLTSEPVRDASGEVTARVGTLADISAEWGAEKERSRFRSLVQNSRDVIAVIDASGNLSYASPAVFELSGFSPEEVTGTPGFDYIHPDDQALVGSHLQEITTTEVSKTVEVRIRHKSGAWIWIEIRAVNRLDDPVIEGIVLNYHDITERRGSVDRLAQSEEQLRMLLDSTGEGIYGVDADGVCTFMNTTGASLFGGTADHFVGKSMHELMHHTRADGSAYPARECPIVQGILKGEMASLRGELVWRHDGSSFPADHTSYPIGGKGSTDGAVVVFQDVTQRLEMEKELHQSEKLFRGAFDAAQTGIALIAEDGLSYVDVNRALREMLGYSKAELLTLTWQQITHPDDLDVNLESFARLRNDGHDVVNISKRYVRKDGRAIEVEVSDTIVRGPDGAPIYFVAHVNDVTERKRAAAEKERLEGDLIQAQKMEAVGQLAGGVAHDFNNILSVILNYAQFAAEGLDAGDERLADIQEISKAGDKAAHLVHQLLAFSRKEIVQARVIDLNEVVTGINSILSRSLGEDIHLDFKAGEDVPLVLADPGRIEQVLLNLAVNARDAMHDGGVLEITTGVVHLTEGEAPAFIPGDYAVITVSDSGSGMDEETVERIFEPFFTTKPRGEGTGMGLSSAYGIVDQAGGWLSVESQLGVGTKFTLHLPATHAAISEVAV